MKNLDDLMPDSVPAEETKTVIPEPEPLVSAKWPSVKNKAKKYPEPEPVIEPEPEPVIELEPEPVIELEPEVKSSSLGDLIEQNKLGLTSKAKLYKKYLFEQPIVEVMVPYMPGDDGRSVMEFNINSFSFLVPKGRYIRVPKDVADRIAETLEADRNIVNGHPLNLANRPEARGALNYSM